MAARADLLSGMSEMPTFQPAIQATERNVITRNSDGTISIRPKRSANDVGEAGEVKHKDATPKDWNVNLADKLDPKERMTIADELIDFFETDERVRETHFRRMADAMELLGITDIPEESAPFKGAATVTHPLIAEACTQFQARAIEEIFPPAGPVKAYIAGKADQKKIEQGDRLADYMNYQLTEADSEYYWSTDQMLFYLPLSGSAFKKIYIDPITGMTTSRFVTAEDFVVPYNARTLQTAPRYAHRYEMNENDVMRAQEKGTFLEHARLVDSPNIANDRMKDNFGRGSMEDVADSRDPVTHEDDVIYTMIEYHIDYRMPWDDEEEIAPPYIVTVERESREVMAVRRNWKHNDDAKQKRVWFVQYKYLPGLGFYGFGLLHIIGSLAKAVSGAVRALLDSACVANLQGGFRSKELKISGELRFVPGMWQPVDCSLDDLNKGFFNLPAKEPSAALATLTSQLIEEGRRFATITENMVGDADNRGPVGTTLALIEQGSKVFSGIHKRMHKSAREEFKLIATLNYEFMVVDEYPYEVQGEERTIFKKDFDGRVDIIPVSDPNIWSSTQRIALVQAGMEMMKADPEVYPKKARVKMHQMMFRALRFPDWEVILPDQKDQRSDPVTENMDFMVGHSTKVFPDQDHAAHIAIHMNFAQHQAAENAELYSNIDPVVQAHIMEHKAYAYRQQIEQQLGVQLPYKDLDDDEEQEDMPAEVERMISAAVMKKLTPPPPTPQQNEEQQQAQETLSLAKAKDDALDIQTIGKVKRDDATHAAKMARDKQAFDAEQKRKAEEFAAEQKRQDEEHRAELRQQQRAGAVVIDIQKKKAKATFAGAKKTKPKKKK
jgi:uncharacterized tellurite resistance protein B-like protein